MPARSRPTHPRAVASRSAGTGAPTGASASRRDGTRRTPARGSRGKRGSSLSATCCARRAGVAVAVHLQHRGQGVFVSRVAPERLAAIEDELRLERGEPLEHRLELFGHPDHEDVVSLRQQRAGHVVLRLFDLRLHGLLVVGVVPFGVKGVEEDGDLHRGPRTRCISRPTVVSAIRIRSPPTAPADGSSSIAGRRPNRSERYPTSGGAMASPARCENSTYAPMTEARTAGGTTSRITAERGPLYQV